MILECIDKIIGFWENLSGTLTEITVGDVGLLYILVAALIIVMVIGFIFSR